MTKNVRLLRNICFCLMGFVILLLAVATVLETIYGTPFVSKHIYGSPLFVLLWGAVAVASIAYIAVRKVVVRKAVFLLHLSFAVILAGALITHIVGEQGTVHLRKGEAPIHVAMRSDGSEIRLPFGISLDNFQLSYYHGTYAPMDFVSTISVHDGGEVATGTVSMNNIYDYHHYRFYQSTYDSDGGGSTLSVYHDPYGIAVTYAGYVMLLLSMLLFFFDKRSRFRQLLHHPALRKAAACVAFAAVAFAATAADKPNTLPQETAERFGGIYVYYNDRICPLQTLARDFTVKLCGKPTYRGMTSEQVLMGWFFYYDDWKTEPMIRIKSKEVRRLLGIDGEYARLADFLDSNGYKLEQALLTGSYVKDLRGVREADEKFNLISMVSTGNALKIFPYNDHSGDQPVWFSVTDRLPASMPHEQWMFVRYCMNYVAENVAKKDYAKVDTLVAKTRRYQVREASGFLPSDVRFGAERLYNAIDFTRPVAMACLAVGIASFFFYCWRMVRRSVGRSRLGLVLVALMSVVLCYIVAMLALRGVIGGHFPASNGFETMQLMAACVLVISIVMHRRFEAALSFGFLLSGFAMLVAMLGEANPSVTQLMPVLSSPLLCIHVAVIMVAYALFGFAMFNGIAAVVIRYSRGKEGGDQIERLQVMSQLMLYPAVFLLAVGIFIGAIWANVSWGRYWGWDPKETWALITMLVYAAALHSASLPALRRPMFFHWFTIIAFLTVVITYFGANFIMAGLHSYA